MSDKKLLVVAGPTAVGKTAFCVELAKKLNTVIINADSRQFYRQTKIGTATPTIEEMQNVPHYLLGHLSIEDYYNVSIYEQDVLQILKTIFAQNQYAILTGGSGLYIDTVCHGIDELPDIDLNLRQQIENEYITHGLVYLQNQLQMVDPQYFQLVDKQNVKRIMRALEICRQTGQTYTSLRKRQPVKRDFQIVKICLTMEREILYQKINQRTLDMVLAGFVEEARSLVPYKHLNALNTVGYKELFRYFEGEYDLPTAIEKIQTSTRRYAKRQMTWFKKDIDYQFFNPSQKEEIYKMILE
ncbi:MAG: tRNA (adenosine(37)-N6)-dimethylallyltransferase MiaA [Bacteroidales bacterium]|nr:tRNA (adenosine(37)-N6)-dimethylallyltransferase MiaA [Bacteroidales bacterium]